MKRVVGTEYRSDYGFSSPNFRVDPEGNLTARSIITATDDAENVIFDFNFTDDENGAIFVSPLEDVFPSLEFAKTQSLRLGINLDENDLFFLKEDKQTFFTEGLQHSSGDTGIDAQGKNSGSYIVTIPASYDENQIFYTNRDRSFFGEIDIIDPIGIFSTVEITDTLNSTSTDNGSLVVAGGIGISKSVTVGESLSSPEINVTDILSQGDINIQSQNKISVIGGDSSVIGIINESGSTIPVTDTTVENSSINNTVIGLETPTSAKFTQAEVINEPNNENDITNKRYVDTRDIVFSIAFGL